MASRGGRGGRGRGGANKPMVPMGHLQFAEVIAMSKEGTDVLYPAMEPPNSSYPDASEARIANTSLRMLGDRKFQPSFLNAPSKATQDIERYSDRYKLGGAKGGPSSALLELHVTRKYNPALHPPQVFEAVIEKKKRPKGEGKVKSKRIKLDNVLGDENAGERQEGEGSGSEFEEDPELFDDEEEEEDNDYEDNYFDNGEDGADEDALGGGGGGDDDGGVFE